MDENNQPRPNGDYTVGWICALATELIAARVFLDEIHSERPQQRGKNDNNAYLLGEAAGHNVVVAVLPAGVYGTSSAANVARDMLRSFENVRIGLMVGIGGGAPSPRHKIHLGDVVVSVPQIGNNGVFQYRFGKNIQGSDFQHTGHLDKPPSLLLGAVATLNARFVIKGNRIDDVLESILQNNPRLRKKFGRPPAETDRLYISNFTHQQSDDPNWRQSCEDTCGSDPCNLVQRDTGANWMERDDEPMIYQGIIASADVLMKNAVDRDNLSQRHGILCFEMEAAGLMNNFPCLVVRGICDYSDTHKNDSWHGYAAMSAAAYTKQLLGVIPPSAIEMEQKLIDHLNSIEKSLITVEHITSTMQETIISMDVSKKYSELRKWLGPFDGSIYHVEAQRQRFPGSGEWLKADSRFQQWCTQPHTFLWVFGLPGCGKTILSSTVVEHVQKTGKCLYFYITFLERETLSLNSLLCSLIWQLSAQHEPSALMLKELRITCQSKSKGEEQKPTTNELVQLFNGMLQLGQETWIVIDALDECLTEGKREDFKRLIAWIREVVLEKHDNLHLLVTSRNENEIRDGLSAVTSPETSISIEGRGLDNDIKDYVQARIYQSDELQRWEDESNANDDLRQTIQVKLLDQAGGMFRYIACQIEELEMCISLNHVREALEDLPKDMNETYSRIMVRVFGRFKSDTIRILQLLLYSARPLRVDKLIDAIAVQLEKSPSFEAGNRIRRPAEIARCCSSLIKLVRPPDGSDNEGALELHLAHFTVQEYLLASPEYAHYFQEVPSRSLIASICISYLQCINGQIGSGESEGEVETAFPFVRYSCESWISHAASTERYDSAVFDKTMEFLLNSDSDCYKYWNHTTGMFEDGYSPIWHACQAGLSIRFLEHLFGHKSFVGMDINEIEQSDGGLLSMTCTRGDVQITRFLMSKGAVVNAGHFLNAAGNEEVVRALLQNAGTSLHGDPQYTSWVLGDACVSGNLGVVRLIIEYESSFVDLVDRDNGPPLWAACANGHEDVALLLLENGADALYDWDHQDLMDLIFEKGLKRTLEEVVKAFPTIAQREHIIQAARIGNTEFVQILWTRGRLKRENLSAALWNAAKADKEDVVRLLLQLGADGRFQYNDEDDEEFQTPLEVAQSLEHSRVVSLLLEAEGKYISSDDQEDKEEDDKEEDEDSEEDKDCQDCQDCQEGSIPKFSSRFNRWWRRRLHRKKEVKVATLTRRGDPLELVPAKLPTRRKISIRVKIKGEISWNS